MKQQSIRNEMLQRPIGDFIEALGEGLVTAHRSGDIVSTWIYAKRISELEDTVDFFTEVKKETIIEGS